jgi:hypothetical protein
MGMTELHNYRRLLFMAVVTKHVKCVYKVCTEVLTLSTKTTVWIAHRTTGTTSAACEVIGGILPAATVTLDRGSSTEWCCHSALQPADRAFTSVRHAHCLNTPKGGILPILEVFFNGISKPQLLYQIN